MAFRFLSVCFLLLLPALGWSQDAATDTTIRILNVVLSTDVEHSKPVNVKANFSMADRYAFCHVTYDNSGLPLFLRFRWYLNDVLLFTYDAKTVSGRNLITYSVATLQPGNWKVDIIAPGGSILKTLKFKVTP
jgi:hypothetical protein